MSPIGSYFKGHGKEVMKSMAKTYHDPKKAKQVFYATANKRKKKKSILTRPPKNGYR